MRGARPRRATLRRMKGFDTYLFVLPSGAGGHGTDPDLLRSMAVRRFKLGDSVSLLADGRVLVGGGDPLLEVYDPRRGAFRPAGRTGRELAFATATRLKDGRVLVAGGYDRNLQINRTAWIVATR